MNGSDLSNDRLQETAGPAFFRWTAWRGPLPLNFIHFRMTPFGYLRYTMVAQTEAFAGVGIPRVLGSCSDIMKKVGTTRT